jgi:phospholipid/cholesterol/gamma-HCH transport system substrate-binding protein
MKPSTSEKIKTGVFVIVTLAVLFVIIVLIGKQHKLFSKNFLMHTDFKNVNGLTVGNYVRFGGINVGIVDDIVIKNDTTIGVDLRLESRIKQYLKVDALASISTDGLMGDKLVQISPGSDSAALLKEGDQIKSTEPVDMDKVVLKFSHIANNAESLTGSLADIMQRINSGQGSLGMLLKNDTLAKRLQNTVSSADQTVKTIKVSADKFNDNMEAAKHNFLLRGFFKRKEKKRVKDSVGNVKHVQDSLQVKKTESEKK